MFYVSFLSFKTHLLPHFFPFSILYVCSVVELYSSFPPTPQHLALAHCHVPAAQYRVRYLCLHSKLRWHIKSRFERAQKLLIFLKVCIFSFSPPCSSEALFPPVLSWLMFVWINIEQEAMLTHGVSGRQEVKNSLSAVSQLRFGRAACTTIENKMLYTSCTSIYHVLWLSVLDNISFIYK